VGKVKVIPEEKIKAAEEFLSGKSSLRKIANRYNVHHSSVEKWVTVYKAFGPGGFYTGGSNNYYPEKLKKEAVETYLSSERSMHDICSYYKIRSLSQLQDWINKYHHTEQ